MTFWNTAGLATISRQALRLRWLLGALTLIAALLPQMRTAHAQYVDCPPAIDLTDERAKLPEIVSQDGRLRGIIVAADAQRIQVLTKPNETKCVPQLRRFYQKGESLAPMDVNKVSPPIPGPTLRAKLGDIVELTFLNQIDTLDYGNTIDRWENLPAGQNKPGAGCDSVTNGTGYPKLPSGIFDEMPNCFHGSTTGNLHFHGTHTSPISTADNVFLGIRPSPRENGVPTVTAKSVEQDFDKFFADCERRLRADNLLEWPQTWKDMPDSWTQGQETMLKAYDAGKPEQQQLWPVDQKQRDAGEFPQWYIGSFPYCFVLPNFPGRVPPGSVLHMGQAPGTMWYHAHKHGSTAIDVSNGMAGAFIIEGDAYDGKLNNFYNNKRAIRFRSEDFTRQAITMVVNQLGGTPKLETGAGGKPLFSINGQQNPTVTMYPGQVQMWRIVNASTISGFYLPALPVGFNWRQIAQDGVQFDNINYKDRAERPVFVAPGNRIDLLVQAPSRLPGLPPWSAPVTVAEGVSVSQAQKQIPPTTILMTIVVRSVGYSYPMPLIPEMPRRPEFLKDIAAGEVTNTRSLTFATAKAGTGSSQNTIAVDDGPPQKFNEKTPLKIDKLNTVEEWTIFNATTAKIDHPFHIHINPFQVTEVFDPNAPLLDSKGHPKLDDKNNPVPLYVVANGTKPTLLPGQCWLNPEDKSTWVGCKASPASAYPGEKTNIWWDVFPIPAATTAKDSKNKTVLIPGYFKMRSRFVDYPGSYVLHCHILAHEDRGMMIMVELATNPAVPMQHH
jgi:FtsP/CotA-like multicopper oxidase with cupredoxin domain